MALISAYPWVVPLFFGVMGMMVGSFLNVVIYRLPIMRKNKLAGSIETFNLAVPRSRCPHCGHLITALENIPVFSYLFLRGRCLECHAPISARYPLFELASGIVSAYIGYRLGFTVDAFIRLFLVWNFLVFVGFSLDQQDIPLLLGVVSVVIGMLISVYGWLLFLVAVLSLQYPQFFKGWKGGLAWGILVLIYSAIA